MMRRFRAFMEGRAGLDQLSTALILLGCIITSALSFLNTPYYRLIGLLPMAVALWRTLSKNREKRYLENAKFLETIRPFLEKLRVKLTQWRDREHRYFRCPGCKRTLRVPANRGKIEISCPHCGAKFKRRT